MKFEITLNSCEAREAKIHIGEIIDVAENHNVSREYREDIERVWNGPAKNMRLTGGEGHFAIGDQGCTLTYDFSDEFVIKVMHFSVKVAERLYPVWNACKGIVGLVKGAAEPLIDEAKALAKEYGPRTEKVVVKLYNNPGLGVVMMVVEKMNQFGEREPMSWYHIRNESGLPTDQLHHLTENGHGEAYMSNIVELTDPELIGDRKKLQKELDRINSSLRDELKVDANKKVSDDSANDCHKASSSGGAVRYFGFDLMGMNTDELIELRTSAVRRRKELNEFPDYDWKFSDRTRFKDLNPADLAELIDRIDTELTFRKY